MWFAPHAYGLAPDGRPWAQFGCGDPYPSEWDLVWAWTIRPALVVGAIVWLCCHVGWL